MKRRVFYPVLALLMVPFAISSALAMDRYTHSARIEISLTEINEKGESDQIEDRTGDLYLDWDSGSCEVQFRKDIYPCVFDRTQDIVNTKSELVMKSLPQARFSSDQIDSFLIMLMVRGSYKTPSISDLLIATQLSRPKEFFVPFYECIDCEKNGKELKLANAYYGSITRSLNISHPVMGKKKLQFSIKVKKMEANKGAFYTIGNDNAAQYGQ